MWDNHLGRFLVHRWKESLWGKKRFNNWNVWIGVFFDLRISFLDYVIDKIKILQDK